MADPDVVFDLSRMAPESRAVYLGVYELGYRDGIAAGRRQADEEHRGRWAVSAAIARQIAQHGPLDELEERRERPDRAERHRKTLRDRGVVA